MVRVRHSRTSRTQRRGHHFSPLRAHSGRSQARGRRVVCGCIRGERGGGLVAVSRHLPDMAKHLGSPLQTRKDLKTQVGPGESARVLLLWLGGAKGDRTPDLMAASHALSQLSYGPTSGAPEGASGSISAAKPGSRRATWGDPTRPRLPDSVNADPASGAWRPD